MSLLTQEIIKNKRDGRALSAQEIDDFVQGIANDRVSEGQIAAMAMAIYFNDMTTEECRNLTNSMLHSGDVIQWSDMALNGPVLDKHSTGGVGDKVSLMLAPIVAACGGYVPMISGRGLGHTGGTLDKCESIPGYNTKPDNQCFRQVVKQVGCAIIGQTARLAPADQRFYATRDITATVDCIPLITASILSKKLAAGLDGLVMDIKTGNGAFMSDLQQAKDLAQTIVDVSSVKTTALITDMSQILGYSAGNALEMRETIDYLTGKKREPLLHKVVSTIAAGMLSQGGLAQGDDQALVMVDDVLASGQAAETMAKMVSALGGPTDLLQKPEQYLPEASIIRPVYPAHVGYVQSIDTRQMGLTVLDLGGGRRIASDDIDYAVGLSDCCHIGDAVSPDEPIAFVHANTVSQADQASVALQKHIRIQSEQIEPLEVIIDKVG